MMTGARVATAEAESLFLNHVSTPELCRGSQKGLVGRVVKVRPEGFPAFSRHSRKLSDMAPVMAFEASQQALLREQGADRGNGIMGASRKSGVAAKYSTG